MEINLFIKYLKQHQGMLTQQQYRTIRGQAVAGDVDGAKKGLHKLLERSSRDEY